MDYLNFELEVGLGSGREYEISVSSPAGEAREIMRFPYDKLTLENRLKDLQIALLRSGGKRRRVASPQEQAVQRFGTDLFNTLIVNEVRVRYDVSQGLAEREEKGLKLILRIQEPELAALPWEFLYDPRKGEYVCLSRSTPIVRYPESPRPVQPLWVKPPLHILGMAVSPLDLNPLDIEREKQRVKEAVQRLDGLITLTWLEGQTWQDLQEAMQRGPWHIFHFIGHGGFNPRSDEGLIVLAGENGRAFELTATNLARLLDHRPLKLVLLNACEGARGGNIDVFSSTASILIRSGVPAVLAMQYEITDGAAIEFSRSFYRAVAQGMPLEGAVVEARKAISIAVNNTVEWGTPVLYLRSTNGRLFNVNLRRDQVNTLYSEARMAVAGENWSAAIEKLKAVLEQAPDHQEAEEALRFAEEQRKLATLYTVGRTHYDAGRWHEARETFEHVQALEPTFKDTGKLLVVIEGRLNEERAATLYAQAEAAAEKEDWAAAIKLLETALAANPADTKIPKLLNRAIELKDVAEIYDKGKEFYAANKWADALIHFEQVTARVGQYKDAKALADEAAEKAAHELQELVEQPRRELNKKDKEKKIIPSKQHLQHLLMVTGIITTLGILVIVWVIWMNRTTSSGDPGTSVGVVISNENKQEDAKKEETPIAQLITPRGMTYVPGGQFRMGREDGDAYEKPEYSVSVKPFFIDINEVTCEEYQKFIKETGHRAPPKWVNGIHPSGAARKPVTGVTWDDANAYAKWAGKRLPTEEEWEFAARGTDGRLYPWGSKWQAGMANADSVSKGMVEVGNFKGTSPFGAYDMVGNAWEWTASEMKVYPGGKLPRVPASNEKVIRGGTYESNRKESTTTYRRGWGATGEADYSNTGFRLAKDIE